MSLIEWTDVTWNPTTGCDKVSPGCDHCYAERMAQRLAGRAGYPRDEPFRLTIHGDRFEAPLKWKRPRRVFVNSMSDLFHPAVPTEVLVRLYDIMATAGRHQFQVLTKRPQRMASFTRAYLDGGFIVDWDRGPQAFDLDTALPNVWLGTSIESERYTWRAAHLRRTPARVRFLSLEPLLGPLPSLDLGGIDWVIVGGESGSGARPMDADWVRDLRDRCVHRGVAFFFKQWGGVSKKATGRELDGRTWDEMPAGEAS